MPVADATNEDQTGARNSQFLFAGMILFVTLACLCVVALVVVFLFLRGGSAQEPLKNSAPLASQTFNIGTSQAAQPALAVPAPTAAATPAGLLLPGLGQAAGPERSQVVQRPAAPPPPFPTPSFYDMSLGPKAPGSLPGRPYVRFLVRAQSTAHSPGLPLPNRLRVAAREARGRAAAGAPQGAMAVEQDQAAALPGLQVSSLPDVRFQPARIQAARLSLDVDQMVETSSLDGYVALKGFRFLVARVKAGNAGPDALALAPSDFMVEDSDGIGYPANASLVSDNPPPSLGPGATAQFRSAFLVPGDTPLTRLQLALPGQAPAGVPIRAEK